MKRSRWKRELGWFAAGFVAPFAVLLLVEVVARPSPLPLWWRLLTFEDTCAYGYCLLLPAVVYGVVLLARSLWSKRRPPRDA